MSLQEIFGEPISVYTRAQAIDDGFLIDVSDAAREAGIKFPVALTSAVWAKCVEVPPGVEHQDERGRLWDVVSLLRWAIRSSNGGDLLRYSVRVRNHNRQRLDRRDDVQLKAVCGPGDDAEPVITVMMEDES